MKTIRNLAMKLLPQNLDDIIGQEVAVNQIKYYLESDNHPTALFVSGSTGTGKGCLVLNYIKASQCENRKKGSSLACGKCKQCKLDPKTKGKYHDVVWVQTGNGDATINSQVNEALEECLEPPHLASINQPHLYRKFIVFDELQSMDISTIEKLLFYLETEDIVNRNRIVFILITMSEERLSQKEPQLLKALIDRTTYIKMRKPTKAELKYYCIQHLNIYNPKIINLLVEAADNSYRGLIRCYSQIQEDISNDQDEDYCADKLYLTSNRRRKILWTLLNKKNASKEDLYTYYQHLSSKWNNNLSLKDFWYNTIEACADESKLLNQMLDDLDATRQLGNIVPLEYDKLICDYLVSERNLSSWHLIKQLQGKNLVDLKIFDEYENINNTTKLDDGIQRRT